jgi:Putative metal-binding motif
MAHLKSPLWVTLTVFVLALIVWIGSKSEPIQAQELERILEIERYPDEPLQLVNLRIGTRSIKEHVKQKFKDNQSKWGIDHVKFNEKDDWVKRLTITLRNTSDKPVRGLQGVLFFKPVGFPMMFSMQLTHSKQLRNEPLEAGAEIELSVNPGLLNHTLEDVKSKGADLRGAVVSFSLETVIFSDELRWSRGHLVRPDSAVPNKWVPVDHPLAIQREKLPVNPVSAYFVKASFRSNVPVRAAEPFKPASMVFATCTQWDGSFQGTSCTGDLADCINRTDLDDNINPGLLSHKAVSGLCVDERQLGAACSKNGNHSRLQLDGNCQVCPDNDGDGVQSAACGGHDCNDTPGSGASINPGASENCFDGIDNNCNGQTDSTDCQCIEERDIWVPGGPPDCSLCIDGIDNDCDGTTDANDGGCSWNCSQSPVLIDVAGNGFDLTDAENGVNFDLNGDGSRERLAWTALQSDDAWLALDRNGDGMITTGTELFGNFTPQAIPPAGYSRNGFNALREYDLAGKGGNADNLITERDQVFHNLLLWQDKNHNGVSEANELRSLKQLDLTAIECNYKEAKRKDEHGNQFRYAAKVRDTRDTKVGRWAWDVFLMGQPSLTVNNIFSRPLKDAYGISFYTVCPETSL